MIKRLNAISFAVFYEPVANDIDIFLSFLLLLADDFIKFGFIYHKEEKCETPHREIP